MKSRLLNLPVKELVLFYRVDPLKQDHIEKLLKEMDIPSRTLGPEALGETVGALAEIPGCSASSPSCQGEFEREAMIISGLNQSRLNHLIHSIPPEYKIALKAVVTPFNQSWSLFKLLEEIQKEHEIMTKKP